MIEFQRDCEFQTGDRVTALTGIGRGFLWPTVAAGELGIVSELGRANTYKVYFRQSASSLWVSADQIAAVSPSTPPRPLEAADTGPSDETDEQLSNRDVDAQLGLDGQVRDVQRNQARKVSPGEAVAVESLIGIGHAEFRIGLSGDTEMPDLVALLLGADRKVRHDTDLVFYNNTQTADEAVALERCRRGTEWVRVDLIAIDPSVEHVVFGCARGSLEVGRWHELTLVVADRDGTVVGTATCPAEGTVRAMTLFEIYRHQDQWHGHLMAEGYASGLAELVANYGVSAENWKPPENPTR